jgi:hypothetical protein
LAPIEHFTPTRGCNASRSGTRCTAQTLANVYVNMHMHVPVAARSWDAISVRDQCPMVVRHIHSIPEGCRHNVTRSACIYTTTTICIARMLQSRSRSTSSGCHCVMSVCHTAEWAHVGVRSFTVRNPLCPFVDCHGCRWRGDCVAGVWCEVKFRNGVICICVCIRCTHACAGRCGHKCG